ncbi:glutamine--fructose-6-phosphate transaminase (isomerizing) [Actinobaculum suis]|uniref:glutamine--fructose-6-phosphate transaminase (isomerizing) n=1 Tax=Actinobaculum suis TaxID=1657 RepID=UPI0008086EF5|nr:glutamine--fructose-6-phosphate transaminase (isomerizing) [Actinobaculum suis]OCA93406.1 glutamine--fructose-6-phosphate aminotransferase [Actinobaculum suis]OCA95308.1 glutamine--fructose-6-phosphate aminotransferase [Actinobaculum suis]
MCGIVGYAGSSPASNRPQDVVLAGLARLEYRGYDSAGVALVNENGEIAVTKRAGRLDNLRQALAAKTGTGISAIGHTRWATHGAPSDTNAHPHLSFDGKVAVVHNGIIENYRELAQQLRETQGIEPVSETDTEIAAHQLAVFLAQTGDLKEAMLRLANVLEGSFTLVAVDGSGLVVAARRNSPLVVGLGNGENFLGSDVAAFVGETRQALEIAQDTVVVLRPDTVELYNFAGEPTAGRPFTVDWDASAAVKGGYATFMDKEIHEEPTAVAETLRGRMVDGKLELDEMRISPDVLRRIDKIVVIAAGTASYAGQVARYAIEHWCRIPVEVELASEFRYRDPVVSEKTLTVAISQSGETMDTIMAIRHAREQGSKVLAIVNTYGSTIARESDAVLYTHAGPEIAVASTKAFVAQIAATYLLGLYLAQLRGNKYQDEIAHYLDELGKMPGRITKVLEQEADIRALAQKMKDATSVLFLGRHVGYPVALEGALKLKEIAYIHAEGFAAGELKHGPIALVEPGLPVFFIVPTPRRPELHAKVLSNLQEVRSRGAVTIVIAEAGDESVCEFAEEVFWVPNSTPTLMMPLVTVLPLQIFASEMAAAKGYDVDKPRNLAKSVTVE